MSFLFKVKIPKSVTWQGVREEILSRIEEEHQARAISRIPTRVEMTTAFASVPDFVRTLEPQADTVIPIASEATDRGFLTVPISTKESLPGHSRNNLVVSGVEAI